ncbi:hypothetical protein [Undibacterium macrobrachii]|jgi:hypothetical protein|uniref:Chorismate mutase n=1 Tax=Undibacterium macrobrachii TaxID=1119058 RepID=A0ABQ2XCF2_9BURK|nr:hypothetical protein [Undibacterium macrobrachii]GGX09623.1 hypothetical protein GCM10011282_14810 [Undibacterium macrobrachii]
MEDFGTRRHASLKDKLAAEAVVERVYLAVEQLCIGQGDVRKRLITSILTLIPLRECEFPECVQMDFDWVIRESTKYKSKYPQFQGDLEVTMMRIRNTTGQKIAQRIFHIYSSIQSIRGFPLLEYRAQDE